MRTEYEKKAVIKLPKDSNACAIETPDHLPKLHQLCIANGKRGSGKSIAITNLIRMYKEELGSDLRCIIVSPTFGSNYKLLSELGINREDVFEEPDDDVPAKLNRIANDDVMLSWSGNILTNIITNLLKQLRAVFSTGLKWMNICCSISIHSRINLSALNQSIIVIWKENLLYYLHSSMMRKDQNYYRRTRKCFNYACVIVI